jgi:hypothetical protein
MPRRVARREVDLTVPITAETVIEILRDANLLRGDASPELKCHVELFAWQLGYERRCAEIDQDFKPMNDNIKETRKLIEKLSTALEKVKAHKMELSAIAGRAVDPESADAISSKILRDEAVRLVDFQARCLAMLDDPALRLAQYPRPRPAGLANLWVIIWSAIRPDFIKAIDLATGKEPGIPGRREGPLVSFIYRLVPVVTGETPAVDTIIYQIEADNKRRKQAKTKASQGFQCQ